MAGSYDKPREVVVVSDDRARVGSLVELQVENC